MLYYIQGQEDSMYLGIYIEKITVFLGPRGPQEYLIFDIFFTQAKSLENKIYIEKTRKLRQNPQKIANFLRYSGKIHSKLDPVGSTVRYEMMKLCTGSV